MNCIDVQKQMFAFLYEEIDVASQAEVRQHVVHCVPCMFELNAEREIGQRLSASRLDDELESALASLGSLDRRIIVLTSIPYLDMSFEDVAAELKCSVEAVKLGMMRARHALRLQLVGTAEPERRELETSYDLQ